MDKMKYQPYDSPAPWERDLLFGVSTHIIVTFKDYTVHTFEDVDMDSWKMEGEELVFECESGELIHHVPNVLFYTTKAV